MAPPILTRRIILLSSLVIPAGALLFTSYLYNHPLPASKTRTIQTTDSLSQSCASSLSVRNVVNPRNHKSMMDSRSIRLSKKEIGDLSDEEILARFFKGFFGGWVFAPEQNLLSFFGLFGVKVFPVGFSSQRYLIQFWKLELQD